MLLHFIPNGNVKQVEEFGWMNARWKQKMAFAICLPNSFDVYMRNPIITIDTNEMKVKYVDVCWPQNKKNKAYKGDGNWAALVILTEISIEFDYDIRAWILE